jgi:hypothetical protein
MLEDIRALGVATVSQNSSMFGVQQFLLRDARVQIGCLVEREAEGRRRRG